MDQNYIQECTRDWVELNRIGNLSLYRFKDTVKWGTMYCLKRDDMVVSVFDPDEVSCPFVVLRIASEV